MHASLCSISVAFPNLYRYYWLVILRSWGISFKYIFVFYRCCRLMSTLGTMPAGHQRGILHHTYKYLACHLHIGPLKCTRLCLMHDKFALSGNPRKTWQWSAEETSIKLSSYLISHLLMMNLCIFCAHEKRYVGFNMVKLFVVSIYSILSVGQMLHTSEKVMINQHLFFQKWIKSLSF